MRVINIHSARKVSVSGKLVGPGFVAPSIPYHNVLFTKDHYDVEATIQTGHLWWKKNVLVRMNPDTAGWTDIHDLDGNRIGGVFVLSDPEMRRIESLAAWMTETS